MNARGSQRRTQRGFTLLETIVTLVVVSLIVVVLMQALQQALGLRTRLLRFERGTRMQTLQEEWFRDSVSSATIDLPDALGEMQGGASSFSMVSAAPLRGAGPGRIAWTLRGDGDGGAQSLVYSAPAAAGGAAADAAGDAPIRVLSGLHDASFAYLDRAGRWRASWKQAPEEPLPRMVRFQAATAGGGVLWLVAVAADGREQRPLRPEEVADGL